MELPSRPKNDRYTPPGRYQVLEQRLRTRPDVAKIPSLVCYAFDRRTRQGPFLFADTSLLTAGPRAVAGALYAAGFHQTRIVLRQWNPNFRVNHARMNGQVPEMLLVSSMQIHSASAYEMIGHAYQLGEARPFILAGGAKAIYEPWDFFGLGHEKDCSADVVVTGEEFVLLELLERLMDCRLRGEHMRRTFHRLRRSGLLCDIPGLVYREGDENDPAARLVSTGTQRLVQNMDELPHPMAGIGLIEPPHRRSTLSRQPLAVDKLHRHSSMIALVTTHGCKFHCHYCPIPAYNQFTFRYKSPERLRDEIKFLTEQTGINAFFGTDDNFFNNRETVEATFTCLSKGTVHGRPFRDSIFFGTEATAHDTYKNRDLLPLCREGGLRALWFGIEDMTAELIKKGQSPQMTRELFENLSQVGICPMSMMMHHDGQPLATREDLYGLVNQINFLRRSGSVSVQVTILTPSVGSKDYEENFRKGLVIEEAHGRRVEDYHFDGNHCIATDDPHPWRKQVKVYLAYAAFYNPLNFIKTVLCWKDPLWTYKVMYQVYGMAGLAASIVKNWGWFKSLWLGPIRKKEVPPPCHQEMITSPTNL